MVGFRWDTIPIFTVQPQYLKWVGLNWKFTYLSMGSLWTSAMGVTPRLPQWKMKWSERVTWNAYAVPGMAVCHYWEAKLIGEVPILGCVIERLWLIIPIQCMLNWVYPDGCIKCCGESVPPLQRIETIRIAASAVMDDWMAILFRCQMF